MADADEDQIRPSAGVTSTGGGGASDSEDEGTPDFRQFAALARRSRGPGGGSTANGGGGSGSGGGAPLPKRGEKDFEPHGTQAQAGVLAGSRRDMHSALAHVRAHQPASQGRTLTAAYERATGRTRVDAPRGKLLQTMGRTDRAGVTWLLPEEALYLLERGDLDVRWEVGPASAGPEDGDEGGGDGDGDGGAARRREVQSFPLSLQAAYALYVGDHERGVSLERFNVYANLRRAGFTVFRGPAWNSEGHDKDEVKPRTVETAQSRWAWLYAYLSQRLSPAPSSLPHGPLLPRGVHRSYSSIYRQLELVPWHDPSQPTLREIEEAAAAAEELDRTLDTSLRVSYYVYKPREAFRKSNPGPPDFRIAVIDARSEPFPTIAQLDGLFASTPYRPPPPSGPENDNAGKMYARLKHGHRSVILAVVDQGVISYMRMADAGFGREKLYDGAGRSRGGKAGRRGGRGGGRAGRGGKG